MFQSSIGLGRCYASVRRQTTGSRARGPCILQLNLNRQSFEGHVDESPAQLTAEQQEVLASLPEGKPVVMLNLLRFRDQAAYSDPSEACSGREAYKRYSQTALQTIAAVGGSVIFSGRAHESLIAPAGEVWHQVFLVRYPSAAAFRAMLSMPQYQACVRHRTAALSDSRLTPITPHEAA